MDPDFWQQRWREGRIGFHQDAVTPLLSRYWDAVAGPTGGQAALGQVLVPLAGKSLDMLWLAARGHRVLGIELSPVAISQFFAEQQLTPSVHVTVSGIHHCADHIDLVQGDIFELDPALLGECTGVFDRAALIALPPALRQRYVDEVHALLPSGCRGLLVTLEYPQHEKQGPPFSVPEEEVRALYARDWTVEVLERSDILAEQPGFITDGVTALETVAYRLKRR